MKYGSGIFSCIFKNHRHSCEQCQELYISPLGGGQIFGEQVAGVNSHPFSVIDQNLDVTLIYHTLVPYMAVIFSKLSILVLTVQLLLIAKLISVDTIRNTKIYRGLKS